MVYDFFLINFTEKFINKFKFGKKNDQYFIKLFIHECTIG